MTWHEDGVRFALEQETEENPAFVAHLVWVQKQLRAGAFSPSWLVDAIFQNHRPTVTLEDAFAFRLVWEKIMTGEVGTRLIDVGRGPHADREVDANQKLLDALATPFRARFIPMTGGGAEGDGWCAWSTSIKLQRTKLVNDEQQNELVQCKPASVPLEVGSTHASRTFAHLETRFGLVRWPYGCRYLVVLGRFAWLEES